MNSPEDYPIVSVIIPTYNRFKLLQRAVASVLAQTYRNFELIIVDDGSTDGTRERYKSEDLPIRYFWQERCGVSAARNKGIKEANGELIALLDSDDVWDREKLKVQVEYFRDHPDMMICQTQEIWIRNGVRVNPRIKHRKPSGWIFKECLPLCVVSPSAVMMRKELFNKVGLFDERLPICEDYDLWLRVALSFPVHLIDEAFVTKYGGHEDQLSHSDWGIDRYRVTALEKILKDPDLGEFGGLVIDELRRKCRIVANGALKRGRLGVWMKYWWKSRKRS